MQYECKQCGSQFSKAWGPAKCAECGSKDLWITGGEITSILLLWSVALVLLTILFLVSYLAFFGGIVGALVALPITTWSVLRRRKKRS